MWAFAIDQVRREVRQRKNKLVNAFAIPPDLLQQYERNFKMLHRKVKKETPLTVDEEIDYNFILKVIKIERILEWTTHVVAVVENEEKTQQAKKKKSGGLFSLFSSKKSDDAEEDVPEDYDSLFSRFNLGDSEGVTVPPAYVWLTMNFALQTGALELTDTELNSSLHFEYYGVHIESFHRSDGFDLSFLVDNCKLGLL
jgi:hypothetical protein